ELLALLQRGPEHRPTPSACGIRWRLVPQRPQASPGITASHTHLLLSHGAGRGPSDRGGCRTPISMLRSDPLTPPDDGRSRQQHDATRYPLRSSLVRNTRTSLLLRAASGSYDRFPSKITFTV